MNLSSFGRRLLQAVDAATFGTILGLGTAAFKDTGTSGNTVPLLDGVNTWSGIQTFSANPSVTGGAISFPATQVPSAGANDLDDYEEGTWTPTILFGAASVGVTYGTRTTGYIKIGRSVIAFLDMTLTSKGSSVGAAQIGGLPFTVTGVTGMVSFGFYQNLAGLTGALTGSCGGTAIDLRQHAAATTAALADTNFTNTTRLIGAAIYQTST